MDEDTKKEEQKSGESPRDRYEKGNWLKKKVMVGSLISVVAITALVLKSILGQSSDA
jgi:hypothetical protein